MRTHEPWDSIEFEFTKDTKTINLSGKEIRRIDISELSSCTNLEGLNLSRNELESIDLTPLKACHWLGYLDLEFNSLQTIDLTPLKGHRNLMRINLSNNQLQNIDLVPIQRCRRLKGLYLSKNQFQLVDVTPLFEHSDLRIDHSYWHNRRDQELNLTSWVSPTQSKLHRSSFDGSIYRRPSRTYSWNFLYQIAERFEDDLRVQHDILRILGLENYGFVERSLSKIFLSLDSKLPTNKVREILKEVLVEEIAKSVGKNGSTTGLKIDEEMLKNSEIGVHIPRILELRNNEIQNARIVKVGEIVDLRELLTTAYGYEIGKALGLRLSEGSSVIDKVQKELDHLGISLRVGRDTDVLRHMSRELKECIWWLMENEGRIWSEVVSVEDWEVPEFKSSDVGRYFVKHPRIEAIDESDLPEGIEQTKIIDFVAEDEN